MSGPAERRTELMKILCRRRKETIRNLAQELSVSERTIRRDIDVLSLSEPIYTQMGRYEGGVYVEEGYSINRMYMTKEELDVLHKISAISDKQDSCKLSDGEKEILDSIIKLYTKPQRRIK